MHVPIRGLWRARRGAALSVGLALALTLSACGQNGLFGGKKVDLTKVATTPLEKSDLMASVNASGKVESAESQKVVPDSKLSGYMIRTVDVKVGDVVKRGDILATLDTSSLEAQVEQQEAALAAQKKQAGSSLNTAERNYSTARDQYKQGRGAGVTSATTGVNNASAGVDNARAGVENAKSNVEKAVNAVGTAKSNVNKAQSGIDTAEQAMFEAQTAYNNAMVMYELGEYSDSEMERFQEDLERAQRGVDDANRSYEDAKRAVLDAEQGVIDAKRAVTDAERGVSDAQQSLSDAQRALNDARKNAADSVEAAHDGVESASATMDFESSEIAIQTIRDQIADGEVKAPMDGTITLSNATVGNVASGVLFMVENVDDLIIKTTVQQFDAPSVTVDQEVIIKSDGTGDKEFKGVVNRIAPTAVKSSTGDLATGSGIEFETEIAVSDAKSGLLIGMSTQLYIVTDRRQAVFAVPFNAIEQDEEAGKNFIYVLEGEGKEMTSRAIEIEIGLETDFLVEIKSDELKAGMKVVNNPEDLKPEGEAEESAPPAASNTDAKRDARVERKSI